MNEINRELQPQVPLEVGGPGYMQYNETWMYAFLDRYAADPSPDKRLDFISWHAYGEFPEGTGDSSGPRAYHFYKGNPSEVAGQRNLLNDALASRGLDTEFRPSSPRPASIPAPRSIIAEDPRPDYLIGAAGVPAHALLVHGVAQHLSVQLGGSSLRRRAQGPADDPRT